MSEGDTIPLRGSADMWRSRAKAAEAENQRLQAEVARLTQQLDDLGHRYAGVESSLHGANARIAELEAEVAILKDVRATEQYLASLPVGDKELDFAKRTATEAALRWVLEELRKVGFIVSAEFEQKVLDAGARALLGEDA